VAKGGTTLKRLLSGFILILALVTVSHAAEQHSASTVAIFTDQKARPLTDQQWSALVAALREELSSSSPEIRALNEKIANPASPVEIIRGDRIVAGISVENPITVLLQGDCTIHPHSPLILFDPASGTLGWVRSDHGLIEPFVHVECNPLAQMLATKAYGRDQIYRDELLATAIARVILHEWIHIANQSPHHASQGLAKAQFGPADLLPGAVHSADR
jgi:hypothetical protein